MKECTKVRKFFEYANFLMRFFQTLNILLTLHKPFKKELNNHYTLTISD